MKITLFIILLLLFSYSPNAFGDTGAWSGWRLHTHGEHIDIVRPHHRTSLRLVTLDTVLAPTQEQALDEAETSIREHTQRLGFEVCGMLCQTDDGAEHGMLITTVNSHMACPVFRLCPSDMRPVDNQLDMHSHGRGGRFRINRADHWLTGEPLGSLSLGGHSLSRFSAADRVGPPGYLVTPQGRRYSPGTGTIEDGPDLVEEPNDRMCF